MARPQIAVLDNDGTQLAILAEVLESEGYAVATLDDLRQGYVFVKACQPALVTLDLLQERQPLGIEVIRVLRADRDTRDIAILVVSADTQARKTQAERFRADGIGVLGKPYDLDELLGLVRQQLPADELATES